MFNNINDNNSFYNSQLERQNNVVNLSMLRSNLAKLNTNSSANNLYVDKTEISSNAMDLYQRDCDIKNFNKIAMSDMNDYSYLEKMQELFADGVTDVFEDDVLAEIANNKNLWDDLGL